MAFGEEDGGAGVCLWPDVYSAKKRGLLLRFAECSTEEELTVLRVLNEDKNKRKQTKRKNNNEECVQ